MRPSGAVECGIGDDRRTFMTKEHGGSGADPRPDGPRNDPRTQSGSGSPANGGGTRRRIELTAFAVVAIIAVVLGVVLFTGRDDGSSGPATASISDEDRATAGDEEFGPLGDLARRDEGDPLAMGAVDAPVVMVEFADYRCPFCAKFSRDVEPELIEQYVDTGKLRIEWRDMPIYGEDSARAARAARAAAEQ